MLQLLDQKIRFFFVLIYFALFSFTTRRFFACNIPCVRNVQKSFFPVRHRTSDQHKQHVVTSGCVSLVRMRTPNMIDATVQRKKPIKHENKRNVISCLIECLMAFKFYQTLSNSTKQVGQTVKRLVTKQCLLMFGRQTFPAWTRLSGRSSKLRP